jgi:hypothetical protein
MTLLLDLFSATGGILISFAFIAALLIPFIFYLVTLQSTLRIVSPENRKMPPSNVWLLLIPVFGLIWHFIVVARMADSISAEAKTKGIPLNEPKPAYGFGLAMCILNCILFLPILHFYTGVAALVCWILYWVKIAEYKNRLRASQSVSVGTAI